MLILLCTQPAHALIYEDTIDANIGGEAITPPPPPAESDTAANNRGNITPPPVLPVNYGDPITNTFCIIIMMLQGAAGRGIASIAVFFMGVGVFAGKVDKWAAIVISGFIAMFYGAFDVVEWATGYRACQTPEEQGATAEPTCGNQPVGSTRGGTCPQGFTGTLLYTCTKHNNEARWLAPETSCQAVRMEGSCVLGQSYGEIACYHPLPDARRIMSTHVCTRSDTPSGPNYWAPASFDCQFFLGTNQ